MSVASNFADSLRIALERLDEDEWAVVRSREALTHGLSPRDAFESIVEVLGVAAKQSDPYAFASCCEATLGLARHAHTTQRPDGLDETLALLDPKAQALGCTKELAEVRKWFRIAA
jgi:gamma-glutamyl:cysteine ligase YbdK (ATP-grasp superfamily)